MGPTPPSVFLLSTLCTPWLYPRRALPQIPVTDSPYPPVPPSWQFSKGFRHPFPYNYHPPPNGKPPRNGPPKTGFWTLPSGLVCAPVRPTRGAESTLSDKPGKRGVRTPVFVFSPGYRKSGHRTRNLGSGPQKLASGPQNLEDSPESAETDQNRVRGSKFGVWARFPSRILRFVTLGEAFLPLGGKFVPKRYFTIYTYTPTRLMHSKVIYNENGQRQNV